MRERLLRVADLGLALLLSYALAFVTGRDVVQVFILILLVGIYLDVRER